MAAKQKILIVDDDNNIAELISLYLTKECFDTRIVNDGEEAMIAFDQYNPNLILLDLMLPGMDCLLYTSSDRLLQNNHSSSSQRAYAPAVRPQIRDAHSSLRNET